MIKSKAEPESPRENERISEPIPIVRTDTKLVYEDTSEGDIEKSGCE